MKALNHIHLGAVDVAATRAFYERWFGFAHEADHGDGVLLRGPGDTLIAIDPVAKRGDWPTWFHVGFCLDAEEEVTDLHAQMSAAGVDMATELREFPAEAAAFYCRDPDGVPIEVSWHRREDASAAPPEETPAPGTIVWRDLTVPDAEALVPFYEAVVGFDVSPHAMGEYDDYNLMPAGTGEAVAGLCHARGSNAGIPPAWMLYMQVADVDAAAEAAAAGGGEVVDGPRDMGGLRFCCLRDPAGCAFGVIGPNPAT